MWLCFRTLLFLTWKKMNGIFHMSGFNRMEPGPMPLSFQRMSSAKYLPDALYPGMVAFSGHPAHLILALLLLLMGLPEVQSIPRRTTHYSRIKRGHTKWNASIPVTMLTNMMRNFNDRLQECINVEGLYLPGIIFHN